MFMKWKNTKLIRCQNINFITDYKYNQSHLQFHKTLKKKINCEKNVSEQNQ